MDRMTELKPCNCGCDDLLVQVTTDYIWVLCTGCGKSNRSYGKRPRYTSLAKCRNAVWPIAVKQWNNSNRRAEDE
jgi:hypothetical protein